MKLLSCVHVGNEGRFCCARFVSVSELEPLPLRTAERAMRAASLLLKQRKAP
jgi:hypothetical protein